MTAKRRVVFICSRNAARSQMAEGFLTALYGDIYDAASAGLRAFRMSRTAIRVMKEAGIDISAQRSKSIGELGGTRFDLVVTLCDEAGCIPPPLLPPGDRYLHKVFPDPGTFPGNEEEVLAAYRDVRDRIGVWIRQQFGPGGSAVDGDLPSRSPPRISKRRKRPDGHILCDHEW
jgi:arsenate reductase